MKTALCFAEDQKNIDVLFFSAESSKREGKTKCFIAGEVGAVMVTNNQRAERGKSYCVQSARVCGSESTTGSTMVRLVLTAAVLNGRRAKYDSDFQVKPTSCVSKVKINQ